MSAIPRTAASDETARRLEAARAEVESARTMLDHAIERRNKIIHEAADGGLIQSLIARLAGLKQPSVVRILGQSYGEVLEA